MTEEERQELKLLVLAGADPAWDWLRESLPHTLDASPVVVERTEAAVAAAERERPRVVLLCAAEVMRSGGDLLTRFSNGCPAAIVLVAGRPAELRKLRMCCGGVGLLDIRRLNREQLRAAIEAAAAGLLVSTPGVTERQAAVALIAHEREVLDCLRRGLTERQMG